MDKDAERAEWARLREDRFHYLTDAEWDAYYQRVAPYLKHPEKTIRGDALERLLMAVLRAEAMTYWQREPHARIPADHVIKRLAWLRRVLEEAHGMFPDIGPAFLREFCQHGDNEPFTAPLRNWLHSWLKQPPDGVSTEAIQGALILLSDHGSTWQEAAPHWLRFLDDPSNYLRGCAAKMLGGSCSPQTRPTLKELFALIKSKEIIRPGIAGPFWGSLQFVYQGSQSEVIEWMLDILEKRNGQEPADLSFCGIDFYLHELCDGSLEAIQRMLQGGHKGVALETATETQGVVDGMKDILLQLGHDPDTQFACRAWEHLARYYQTLHPCAKDSSLVCQLSHWDDEAEAFVIRQGGDIWRDVLVIYPKNTASTMDDPLAWKLIDKALPAPLRGAASKNTLGINPDDVPYRLGNQVHYEFEAGPIVTLEGDPDKKLWSRIDIIGRGIQNRWDPRPGLK